MSDRWRPTGGKDYLLDDRLNLGLWHDRPIYIHITSQEGFDGISKAGLIKATPKTDRRGLSAKNGIYINPSTQAFSPEDAWLLLFFEEEKYRFSSRFCFVFAFHEAIVVEEDAISSGSWIREIIYRKDISFKEIDILYSGPNPFVSLAKQNHPKSALFS
jgi:hypothetical protein